MTNHYTNYWNTKGTLSMFIVDFGEYFPGELPGKYVGFMNELFGN